MTKQTNIKIDGTHWSLEDLYQVADNAASLALSDDKDWQGRVRASAEYLSKLLDADEAVYGVNTGYGESCRVKVSSDLLHELPLHLTRFHGCGLGATLDDSTVRAVMFARIVSLAKGYSGVRMELLEHMIAVLNAGVIPVIPEEGSVGASGDLTPLSYIAAVLVGERTARLDGTEEDAESVLARAGLTPIELHPKEGLALMNGTSVMTGMAALALRRAETLLRLSCRVTALGVEALMGNRMHYCPELFQFKPHPGQAKVAQWIFDDLHPQRDTDPAYPLQDRYSFRCAPHVLGVLGDALPGMRTAIETELNSVNDNPLIDGEQEKIYHGGHFYGGHIAFAMDGLKNAVANIADLHDRQVALITDIHANNGLPRNLSGAKGARAEINHGFKALQISVSAWTAEALKLTMPASVFSRSTECHNQDKVSMGTISARDAVRVLELTEQVVIASLLIMQQGVQLRLRNDEMKESDLTEGMYAFVKSVESWFPFLDEDRPLDETLKHGLDLLRRRKWSFA